MRYVKRILAWLLFLCGLALLFQGASWLVVPKDNTAKAGMEQARANGILAEPPNSIDILVLGDSESYTCFSPLLLWKDTGYTSYTCGTDSQKLPYTKLMLERALENQNPKLVILETLTIYRPIYLGDMALEEVSRQLPLFRYHDRWKHLSPADLTPTVTATEQNAYKGHVYRDRVDPCPNQNYMLPTQQAATIPLVNRHYVQAIWEICQSRDIPLLLISAPSPINWNTERHNGIQALSQELGCPYLDLNLENLSIDWSRDTFDRGDHLNHFGAVKVTNFLANYLQNQYGLSDHRNDSAYESWNQLLASYEDVLSKSKGTSKS